MEKVLISTCKKTKRSKWGNDTVRNTDAGMKMFVIHEDIGKGKKSSRTVYES